MSDLDNLQKLFGGSNIFGALDENFQEINKIIKKSTGDLGNKTIVTKFGDGENQKFITHIKVGDEDIENIFPSDAPNSDNVYWKRHNELVNTYLDARKQMGLKAIETVGTSITGIISPLSK